MAKKKETAIVQDMESVPSLPVENSIEVLREQREIQLQILDELKRLNLHAQYLSDLFTAWRKG